MKFLHLIIVNVTTVTSLPNPGVLNFMLFFGFMNFIVPKIILSYGTLGISGFDSLHLCHNWKYGKGLERCSVLAEDLSSVPRHLECSSGFETPLASVSTKKDLVPVAHGSHSEVTAMATGPFCSVSQSLGLSQSLSSS